MGDPPSRAARRVRAGSIPHVTPREGVVVAEKERREALLRQRVAREELPPRGRRRCVQPVARAGGAGGACREIAEFIAER